jgi:hypothetical protein
MKTRSLKQIRNAALCLAAAVTLGYGLNAAQTVAQPAPKSAAHHLLADGVETHGGGKGNGHRSAPRLMA